jgi:CDP-paratose 2-epimerase
MDNSKPKCTLITGSSGLIGSEATMFFDRLGWDVFGIDNNMRNIFFGPEGDTTWNLRWLQEKTNHFHHNCIDIRDRKAILSIFQENKFDLIIHCAAQPSHDLAAKLLFEDWDTNATGTLNLLEATRKFCPESPFIYMSTNKIYGDSPNHLPLVELETRYDYSDPKDYDGISENFQVDQCLHSIFGASKLAADFMAQEFGQYFGMPIGIFRGGCLTGAHHSGVQLHGFLSYLVKVALLGKKYTIFGYKGKQVRDNLHSRDVVNAFYEYYKNPRPGEVYNIGGGRENSISIIEAIEKIEQLSAKKIDSSYIENPRRGDHICYISDLTKLKSHYPNWSITRTIDEIIEEMIRSKKGSNKVNLYNA